MLFTYLIKVLLLFLENKFIKHFDWTELMLDSQKLGMFKTSCPKLKKVVLEALLIRRQSW